MSINSIEKLKTTNNNFPESNFLLKENSPVCKIKRSISYPILYLTEEITLNDIKGLNNL